MPELKPGRWEPSVEALLRMKAAGGEWYAYQNHDLGHQDQGMMQFLKCGEGCTYEKPPPIYPDTKVKVNWRYVLVGRVDLETGVIVSLPGEPNPRRNSLTG